MKTAVIGFPRIGEKRELKKVTEKFLKGYISKEELFAESKKIKLKHWNIQKDKGIDYISSNDFSLYDNFLDTIIMLNAIPEKYKNLNLDEIDLYFSMAKGYQNKGIDIQALPMKKWFNTNYHYLVPKISKDTKFKLNTKKIILEYREAKAEGIETKPSVIGPLTFLKLSNYDESKYTNYVSNIKKIYKELVENLNKNGIKYLQIDEPILSTDLNKEDILAFNEIYKHIFSNSVSLKIILQTYFGDVRDIYNDIIKYPFYAIGLDFIEGEKNLELINKFGYPSNMHLFTGIINGKNIWRNDYKKTIIILKELFQKIDKSKIVLNSSCSLLHVPFSLKNENNIEKYKKYLAFAEEKLTELNELKSIININYEKSKEYIENQKNIKSKNELKEIYLKDIRKKVEEVSELILKRKEKFEVRNKKQNNEFNFPLLPTTTIGSFPQTKNIRKARKDYKENKISKIKYENYIKGEIEKVIRLQEEIGLDVLVHGEFERNDMVEYFGENLTGFLFTENGWVQSYGTRGVKPPIIFGDIKREKNITVDWIRYANKLTPKPVKGMLTGPITIQNWSFVREDLSLKEIAFQIGLAIQEEVAALEENGIKIIQIDEAALRENLPLRKDEREKYLDWAIKAFRLTNYKVNSKTQIHTHMCYSEFGDIIDRINDMDADVLTIESAKSEMNLLDLIGKKKYNKELGPGIYDVHSPRIPSVEELVNSIDKILTSADKEKLWINPDCGLKTRGTLEAIESLKNIIKATKIVRKKLS